MLIPYNPFTDIYTTPSSLLKELHVDLGEMLGLLNKNNSYFKTKYLEKVEKEKETILSYSLAGVEPEDITVELTKEWLKIEYKLKDKLATINEYIGNMEIDKEKATLDYRNGVLNVTLPKGARASPTVLRLT